MHLNNRLNNKVLKSAVAFYLLISQILILVLYYQFFNYQIVISNTQKLFSNYYLISLFILLFLGFGFLFVYFDSSYFVSLWYNLLIFSFVLQYYFLIKTFYIYFLFNKDNTDASTVYIELFPTQKNYPNFLHAIECCISIFIILGTINKQLSPLQIFMTCLVIIFGYQAQIEIFNKLNVNDIGGSMKLFLYSGVTAFGISYLLQKIRVYPKPNMQQKKLNIILSFLGLFFIFSFFCSISAFNQISSVLVSNSIISIILCTSTSILSSYCTSIYLNDKLYIHDLVFGAISGMILISSNSQEFNSFVAAIIIGNLSGVVTVLWLNYFRKRSNKYLNGTFEIFMINGLLGGICSLYKKQTSKINSSFLQGIGISLVISIISSIIIVGIIYFINKQKQYQRISTHQYFQFINQQIN